MSSTVATRTWPGLSSGLLTWSTASEDSHRPGPSLDDLVAICERHDLRGRGGSGFPLSVKLLAVHSRALEAGCQPHLVVNGEEGEPSSVKDRFLLANRADLVLDGAALVARALRTQSNWVYASESDCLSKLKEALNRRSDLDVALFAAVRGYVSGEETAAIRAIMGGPAKPTAKPPRPFESGFKAEPTLVSNVETLAQLARIVHFAGTTGDTSAIASVEPTILLTVVTDDARRWLVEVPTAVSLRDVLVWLDLWPVSRDAPDIILGGYFGGIVADEAFDVPLSHQSLRSVGHALGCGIVIVVQQTCPVTAVARILRYLDAENAQQCGPCFKGIPAMGAIVEALCRGSATADDLTRLETWSNSLRGRGDCGTLDAACGLVASTLSRRGDLVRSHLIEACGRCSPDSRPQIDPFAVPWPADFEEDS